MLEACPNAEFIRIENAQQTVARLKDIFTEQFMQEHTHFQSFEGFRYSSAVFVNWDCDTLIYSPRLLDQFTRESTEFTCWEDMVRTAADLRYRTHA